MVLSASAGRPFVLLDRDGTLIEERGYLRDVHDVRLLPNAVQALHQFRALGLGLAVVTNQSGIARGYFDSSRVDAVHARIRELLASEGLHLDGFYVCPHLPDAGCACRKPQPGLGLQAARELGIDLPRSFAVGDKLTDVAWGEGLGATAFLVRTGHGAGVDLARLPGPDRAANDLLHAAELIQRRIHWRGKMERKLTLEAGEARGEAGSLVRKHVLGSIDVKQRLLVEREHEIEEAAELLSQSLRSGGKLLLCGNGGSAADCQHLAAEFVSALSHDFERPGLAAIALTTDTSLITAHANDFGFGHIFERQVQALGRPGDVLIGISTSGESENVVRAFRCARLQGLRTVALTGHGGGRLLALADVCVRVPSTNTQYVQESHITIAHLLCMLVESAFVARPVAAAGWGVAHAK